MGSKGLKLRETAVLAVSANTKEQVMKKQLAGLALMVVLASGGVQVAQAAGVNDFPRNTVLPAAETLIGWQQAFNNSQAAVSGGLVARLRLEREDGIWVYRADIGAPSFRQSTRLEMNALTGAITRNRRSNAGGGDVRNYQQIAAAANTITVTFAQAAAAAETRVPGLRAHDIKLERSGNRPLSYKVEMWTTGAAAEVRIDAATGAIISVQTVGRPSQSTNPGSGGINPPAGGGNNPPAGGGTTPEPVALSGDSLRLANAISTSLATEPEGTIFLEAKIERNRFQNFIEVKTVESGSLAAEEIRLGTGTGAIFRRESESLDSEDAAEVVAVFNALAGQTAIGHVSAMGRALAVRAGTVTEVELQMNGTIVVYEVKVSSGGRERSVKVNALTGAIVQ
jgi:uncharacterized membrane protein YkoI